MATPASLPAVASPTADTGTTTDTTVTTTAAAGSADSSTTTTATTSATAAGAPDDCVPEEEVTEGNWQTPQVEVHEVKTVSGEEDEDVFWKFRAKLYRWAPDISDKDVFVWKERGLGEAKLLKHKEKGKIRFLLRQEKTLKVVANHYVYRQGTMCELRPNSGSDKIWVWSVTDYAEEEPKHEQFALKFGQVEQANIFKQKFEEACEVNAKVLGGGVAVSSAAAGGAEAKDGTGGTAVSTKEPTAAA